MDTPRACLRSESLCEDISFHSYDIQNLTQLAFGLCKEDAHKYMPLYLKEKTLKENPFTHVDERGVGSLIRMSLDSSKETRPQLRCGAVLHGQNGDARSVKFFHRIGLDYVTCAPAFIPIAKISAAQAHISSTSKQWFRASPPGGMFLFDNYDEDNILDL
eukprot:gene40587-53676_t